MLSKSNCCKGAVSSASSTGEVGAYFSSNRSDEGDRGEFVHRLAARGAVPLVPSTGEVVNSVATGQMEEVENALKISLLHGGRSLWHLRQQVSW